MERVSGMTIGAAGLQWFAGDPTSSKPDGLGDAVGTFEFLKGSYALGSRCPTCRKITLDY